MNTKDKPQELPFVDLMNTDGRNKIREISLTRTERNHLIDFDNIRLRPGKVNKYFNARIQPAGMTEEDYEKKIGIPELAEAIFKSNGSHDDLVGDIKDGIFYVNGGERRYRAIRHLLACKMSIYPNGTEVRKVGVILNPKGFTDADRRLRILSSDNNLRYTTMERARAYLDMKTEDELTDDQIAANLGVSRQTVSNYIMLTELPAETQQKIEDEILTMADALKDHRKEKKEAKAGKLIVDQDTGEELGILTVGQERILKEQAEIQERLRGDESEFEQPDNSVPGVSSMGGPKGESSGAHVIGTDSIYVREQTKATWKQFVNRYEKLKKDIIYATTTDNANLDNWEEKLAERLQNEYNLTVK